MATRWVAIFFVFMTLIFNIHWLYIPIGGDMKSFLILITVALLFTGCSSGSVTTQPVQDFDLNRYLGQWYEIARIDFKYEKNMDNTTAYYSKNSNGTVKVVNKGYDFVKKVWKESEGKAKFRGEPTVGALKVSFFGPFYSDYNILALDDYKYALVAGKTDDNLWILSREKTIPDDIKKRYLEIAMEAGFDTSRLYWVEHD